MDLDLFIRLASELFANPLFIFTICGLLVAGMICIWIFSDRILSRIQSDSQRALRALSDDLPKSTNAIELLPKSPVRDRLSNELHTVKLIDGHPYRIPLARSSDGFAFLLHKYADTRTLDAWPNIFVGVGLFLTFLGLSLSLWAASRGAASGDIAIVKQSVTTLLEFSAAKFTTSLFALLCSITLSIVLRLHRHRAEVSLDAVDERLEQLLPCVTMERIAIHQLSEKFRNQEHRENAAALVAALSESLSAKILIQHLEEILEQAREQTAHLQTFNADLAIQLGEALDTKLQPMLAVDGGLKWRIFGGKRWT